MRKQATRLTGTKDCRQEVSGLTEPPVIRVVDDDDDQHKGRGQDINHCH